MDIIRKKAKVEIISVEDERKEELVKIIVQCLNELGYKESAALLEQESGFRLEPETVKSFKEGILEGNWDEVSSIVHSFELNNTQSSKVAFQIKQQKYLELIESGDYLGALQYLRSEITPSYTKEASELHKLASHLLCKSSEELKETAQWEGSDSQARQSLLAQVQTHIPSKIIMPQDRLVHLISQALYAQMQSCRFHRGTINSHTLLEDHNCDSLKPFSAENAQVLEGGDEVWDVAFSNAGDKLAVSGKSKNVKVWKLEGGEFKEYKILSNVFPGSINSIDWSPNDSLLLVCGNNSCKIISLDSEEVVIELIDFTSKVTSVGWVSDSHFLTGSVDKRLVLWKLPNERVKVWSLRVRQLAVSSDKKVAAVLNAAKSEVLIINLENLEEIARISDEDVITSVSINADGSEILLNTSFHHPCLKLWELGTQHCMQVYRGHLQERFELRGTFAGADEVLTAIGGEDGRILIWNKLHGTSLGTLTGHVGPVNSITTSPVDHNLIVSCGDDFTVRIWILDS